MNSRDLLQSIVTSNRSAVNRLALRRHRNIRDPFPRFRLAFDQFTLRFHFAVLLLIALSLPTVAADKANDADDSWMQGYYQKPQPERFEADVSGHSN